MASEPEIRLDPDGRLDEVCGTGHFHLERMDDGVWWMRLDTERGSVVVNLWVEGWAPRRIEGRAERDAMSDLWPEMEVGEAMDFGAVTVANVYAAADDGLVVAEVWGSTPAQALSRARAVAALGAYEALAEAVRAYLVVGESRGERSAMSDRWPEMEVGEPEKVTAGYRCWVDGPGVVPEVVASVIGATPAQALSRARAVAAIGEMEALVVEAARCQFGCGSVALWDFCDRARALLARLEADDG